MGEEQGTSELLLVDVVDVDFERKILSIDLKDSRKGFEKLSDEKM